eukprot:m51a1_g6607 hypothetical protein (312) ;mRNA; r:12168-13529
MDYRRMPPPRVVVAGTGLPPTTRQAPAPIILCSRQHRPGSTSPTAAAPCPPAVPAAAVMSSSPFSARLVEPDFTPSPEAVEKIVGDARVRRSVGVVGRDAARVAEVASAVAGAACAAVGGAGPLLEAAVCPGERLVVVRASPALRAPVVASAAQAAADLPPDVAQYLRSIEAIVVMMSVCQLVVVLQEGECDLALWRLVKTAAMLKWDNESSGAAEAIGSSFAAFCGLKSSHGRTPVWTLPSAEASDHAATSRQTAMRNLAMWTLEHPATNPFPKPLSFREARLAWDTVSAVARGPWVSEYTRLLQEISRS